MEAEDAGIENSLVTRLTVKATGDKRRAARIAAIVEKNGMWGISTELSERDLSREGHRSAKAAAGLRGGGGG